MPQTALHPEVKVLRGVVFGSLLFALAGCQSLTSADSFAHIRIVDLASDAAAVDVYHGSNAVAYNLNFGNVTSYVPVMPGNYTLTIDSAGSKQVLSSLKGALIAGGQYTMLVNGFAANLRQTLLSDLPEQPSSGNPSIRLIHEAPLAGPVDVYVVLTGQRLSTAAPIAINLAAGVATSYLPIPLGSSAIVMLPAGAVPSAALAIHLGRQVHFGNSVSRTLILVDAQPSAPSPVQVIMTTDTEP